MHFVDSPSAKIAVQQRAADRLRHRQSAGALSLCEGAASGGIRCLAHIHDVT